MLRLGMVYGRGVLMIDIIVVRADPLFDLMTLSNVEVVVKYETICKGGPVRGR